MSVIVILVLFETVRFLVKDKSENTLFNAEEITPTTLQN